jgi:PTS system nitrogen regulatory IIA component
MNIASLLTSDRILCGAASTSKKRLLETLADMLAKDLPELDVTTVFEGLLHRERLGSTGIGHGVAIPHGRLPGVNKAIGALITLHEGIDYDAPDQQPVDLLFALIVPEESTEEHLQILATLAQSFSSKDTANRLRQCSEIEQVLMVTGQWEVPSAA